MSGHDLRAAGRAIAERLTHLECFSRSWRFCCYPSIPGDIPTHRIIRACFDAGREVCVPAWDAVDRRYGVYALDPGMLLTRGPKGIREPAVKIPVPPRDVDLFVLPGLAFDLAGGRLGYGGGHYDRILAKAHRGCSKVALALDWQVLDAELPLTEQDIRADWILTDTRTIDCRARRAAERSVVDNHQPPSGPRCENHEG
jgi:5-formyltetrahydrofolate cyclo-ligase